jgi:hypothetical protein
MKKIIAAVLLASSTLSMGAYAALPASVGTTVTSIQADGQSVFDLVFPVVAAFVGLTIVIKLFKRFAKSV